MPVDRSALGADMSSLREISWDEFHLLGPEQKVPYFSLDGRIFHTLLAQQFDRQRLEALGLLATKIRSLAKSEEGARCLRRLLAHKRAMLYFTQPSTRTFCLRTW